jgi:hypothetical protein
MVLGYGACDAPFDLATSLPVTLTAIEFGRDHETLFFIHYHAECRAAPRSNQGMASLDRDFDIVWVVVSTCDDDEVLQSAGQEQLTFCLKAEVASPKKGAFPSVGAIGIENLLRFVGPIPVTLRYA